MENTNSGQINQRERLMAMGQMAASLAHEIRNPLGSMELFCTLLKKDLHGQPSLLNAAEQIHLGIRTLDRIISNCLQFARDINPRLQKCSSFNRCIERAVGFSAPKAKELEVKVEVCFEELGVVEVDEHLVEQVLVNVIVNAIEAAALNPVNKTVGVKAYISQESLVIEISDTGPGIPPELKEQIFDPFFTTKSGGTGLGLAIVHSIVSAHKGEISIKSPEGGGTEVVIKFPKQRLG